MVMVLVEVRNSVMNSKWEVLPWEGAFRKVFPEELYLEPNFYSPVKKKGECELANR